MSIKKDDGEIGYEMMCETRDNLTALDRLLYTLPAEQHQWIRAQPEFHRFERLRQKTYELGSMSTYLGSDRLIENYLDRAVIAEEACNVLSALFRAVGVYVPKPGELTLEQRYQLHQAEKGCVHPLPLVAKAN